jgi:FkbM family methyltransferase
VHCESTNRTAMPTLSVQSTHRANSQERGSGSGFRGGARQSGPRKGCGLLAAILAMRFPNGPVSISETARSVLRGEPRLAFAFRWWRSQSLQRFRRRELALGKRFGTRERREITPFIFEFDLSEPHDAGQLDSYVRGIGYEPETVALMRRWISPGSVFVDVGANNGLLTLVAAAEVEESGRVYSFEPNPRAFARLERNITINPRLGGVITATNIAISDVSGSTALFVSRLEDGLTSTLPPAEGLADRIEVRQETLDDLFQDSRVDWVKVDVEGAESRVIRGMTRLLTHNPELKLIVEWNPDYASRELWSTLSERFEISRIRGHRSGFALARLSSIEDTRFLPICNLFCRLRSKSVTQ